MSFITNIIKEHSKDWMLFFAENYPKILIRTKGPYALFHYNINANFKDPVIREARGIIINTETCEVVCWPFTKFSEYEKTYADEIDWGSARVEEKLDGSLIKMWWDEGGKRWRFATKMCIVASDAPLRYPTETMKTFQDVIESTPEYSKLKRMEPRLDKKKTYLFELTGPYNKVVLIYNESHLTHIGTRDNILGKEYDPHAEGYIGIPTAHTRIPKKKEIFGLGALIQDLESNPVRGTIIENVLLSEEDFNAVTLEGFVVVDKYFRRIKVKNPMYLAMHDIAGLGLNAKRAMIAGLLERADDDLLLTYQMIRQDSEHAHLYTYYDYKVREMIFDINRALEILWREQDEKMLPRKELAKIVMDRFRPLKFPIFLGLDTGDNFSRLWHKNRENILHFATKYISNYESMYKRKREEINE